MVIGMPLDDCKTPGVKGLRPRMRRLVWYSDAFLSAAASCAFVLAIAFRPNPSLSCEAPSPSLAWDALGIAAVFGFIAAACLSIGLRHTLAGKALWAGSEGLIALLAGLVLYVQASPC